ncbi:MAG: MFS transporter [Synechococcales bacterium]|nr:MFS transporter [Synechococcales bacterium]
MRGLTSVPSIHWKPVLGLAVMQGSITLTWVIYNLYIPQLLVSLDFPEILGLYLLVIENLLTSVMEPLMGLLSDRVQTWLGLRFPWVILGTLLSTALFFLLPWTGNLDPGTSLRWLLPIGAVVWALAMALFRAPVLGLLGSSAERSHWPQAASLIMLTGMLANNLSQPAHHHILKNLGAIGAFGLGSASLLLAVIVFSLTQPPEADRPMRTDSSQSPIQPSLTTPPKPLLSQRLLILLLVGVGIGLGSTFLRRTLSSPEAAHLLTGFTTSHLITILPAGWLAKKWGNHRCLVAGMGIIGGLMSIQALLAPLLPASWLYGLAIALGIAFSFVLNGTLPFALAQAPTENAGFATGAYFSGTAIATAGVRSLDSLAISLSNGLLNLAGAIAFLVASALIIQNRIQTRRIL